MSVQLRLAAQKNAMERYLSKHIKRAKSWAEGSGSPKEIAELLVAVWNDPPGWPGKENYPETPQFRNAVASLIELTRDGEEIEAIRNKQEDPLCCACGRCKR